MLYCQIQELFYFGGMDENQEFLRYDIYDDESKTMSMAVDYSGIRSADNESGMADSAQDAPVTIKITWWGGQGRHDYTQKLLDTYSQSHPNVTFEAIPSGWDGYFDKLATQAASGSMPDTVRFMDR